MLSSLTGGDKQHPKLGGCVGVFFQLFDWNRRLTGKKLFSNRLLPAERPKQISKKYSDEKLPMAKLLLIADENRGGFPNTKKSSGSVCSSTEEVCCSSSEEGNESSARAPGVVARLMGLESLPAKDLPEHGKEFNTRPPEPRPLPELLHQRKHPDLFHDDPLDQFNSKKHHSKLNGLLKKPVEARPQKLQKTGLFEKRPVSKFQTDTLPFKSILSPSKTHNKLVSPIKSPGILSAKNAARLIEAAAKILEPGMQANNRARNPLIRSSVARSLLKDQEGDDRKTTANGSSRLSEAQKKSGGSNALKSLKGQALSRSWNGKEDVESLRSNAEQNLSKCASSAQQNNGNGVQDSGKRKPKLIISSVKQEGPIVTTRTQSKLEISKATHVRKQEKTVSLALEAKANVQRREIEPTSASSSRAQILRSKIDVKEDSDESEQQQQLEQEDGRNTEQKPCFSGISRASKLNPSASNSRQNNQLLSREKGSSKNNRFNQQTSKALSGEPSSRSIQRSPQGAKDFVASNKNVSGNLRNNNSSRIGSRKDGSKEKEDRKKKTEEKKGDSLMPGTKASPRKKRMSDGHFPSENTCFMDSTLDDECRIFSEKKGFSRNVKGMVPNGKESSGNRSKRESLKYAETYGEGNKKGQWNARQDSQSCSKSMDVVSFTFSSPMRSTGGSQTGIHMMEKKQGQGQELDDWRERQNACWRDPPGDSEPEKIISEVTCTSSASSKPSISEGDSLNALLEQKLRELTSGGGRDLGTGNSSKDSIAGKTTASILQDLILTLNTGRPVQIDQEINHSTGPSHSDKARQSDLTSEDCLLEYSQTFGENTKFQISLAEYESHPLLGLCIAEVRKQSLQNVVSEQMRWCKLGDMVCNFADNGQPRGFSGSGYVPSRGSTVLTDMEDPGGASGQVCSEDCDQPSPVSILEASFSNESCNSSESLDSARDDKLRLLRSSVQNRAGRACPVDERQGQGLDVDAELSDSATSANFELVESDKIMDAILDISRMHKIDPSSIGLAETQPVCLEDQELEYVREIVCNADLLSQDAALLDEDEIADFLVDPHLFDRLEAEEASTDDYSLHRLKNSCYNLGFRKAQGSWQNRKLLFDCVKDCLSLKYNSRYRGGYRTWVKGPTCVVKEQLAREVYEEIVRWRKLAFGMLDEIVEKDMSTPMGKWTDFETEMFEIGVEIEKNIFRVLVEEVVTGMELLAIDPLITTQIANIIHIEIGG
eukprot:Gb_15628 [translate_table: standard]